MNPLFHTEFSISDSLKNVRKSVLIYETIIGEKKYHKSTIRIEDENKKERTDFSVLSVKILYL